MPTLSVASDEFGHLLHCHPPHSSTPHARCQTDVRTYATHVCACAYAIVSVYGAEGASASLGQFKKRQICYHGTSLSPTLPTPSKMRQYGETTIGALSMREITRALDKAWMVVRRAECRIRTLMRRHVHETDEALSWPPYSSIDTCGPYFTQTVRLCVVGRPSAAIDQFTAYSPHAVVCGHV